MINLLLKTLEAFPGVDYLIRETKTSRIESYNIKKQSEMGRELDENLISLTLYVTFSEDGNEDEKKYRGSYNTDIHPGTGADELKGIIEQGVYAAGFVKNEYYPLVSPAPPVSVKKQELDARKAIADLQTAFFASDSHPKGHLSYSEFFITKKDVRIINSNGVDVGYTVHSAFIETAVHMPTADGGEIEICEAYRFSLDDVPTAAKYLQDRVAQLFVVAEKKAVAKPTPLVGDINILLSGECLSTFFSYYRSCADAQMIYQQLSTFKEGAQVQGEGDSDRITVTLNPHLDGSSYSCPYDEHGLPLESHTIIEKGKLLKYWGNTRFASYLNIAPTGNIYNVCVAGGTATDSELRTEPYLELVSFSDFQVNPITGDFGSEIRLGFYFDGSSITPVTVGSISGNMAKVQKGLRMSVDQNQYNDYKGPGTVCIRGASISGVDG